jgi:transglutaminase-like putative cysteine protease
MMKLARALLLSSLAVAGLARSAFADAFPPITEAERALTAVPKEPNAPAVVLFKKAEFLMWGYDTRGAISSRLLVQGRVKILTEEGKDLAKVALTHSGDYRLSSFKGRTVLPDGREVPVGSDARFERKQSKRRNESVTTVAFPAVEVGAILDYQYEMRFESIYFLEPWYFSDDLPVLHSEIVFKIPKEVQAMAWNRDPFRVGLKRETLKSSRGSELRVSAENLPSVPDDPMSPPFADLATQMMMVPSVYDDGTVHTPLMESWASISGILGEGYGKARRNDDGVAKKAKEIADAAGPGARERAEALYRFVRDQIATGADTWIGLPEGASVEKALSEKRGSPTEKALLLESLLRAAKLEAKVVWAANRWRGQIDPSIANPLWFDRMLVAVDVDGKRSYLDPSDRALAFGWLRAGYDGMPALVPDPKKPEGIVLPDIPFDQNGRRAVLDLELDGAGRLTGKGEIAFTGHHAWEKIDWKEDDAATLTAWKEWLGEEYKGFQVEDVRFQELRDEQTVKLTWSLAQREEEVLGDETSFAPSRPLGPLRQPFLLEAAKRRSPVLFAYPDRDEVELRLRWPEGWKVEAQPRPASAQNRTGALSVSVEVDEAGRALVYRRRFDVTQRELGSMQLYEEARSLFGQTEKSDAEALVLVRR